MLLTEDYSAIRITKQITFQGLDAYKTIAYKKDVPEELSLFAQ